MKKLLKLFSLIVCVSVMLVGCGVKNADNIINSVSKKISKSDSYYLEGTMEIINNEDTYKYDVTVSYKKGDYYKIDLINTLNNHEQVILRNDDGVYVVTPSLNKSFKFQSDWPYNNSQVYLINSIIDDLKNDKERSFKSKDKGYVFKSSVNYPNNKSLVNQNVYVDKNNNITSVEVVDKDGKVQISMNFDKIKYNKKFENDYFELSKLINTKEDKKQGNQENSGSSNTQNNQDNTSDSTNSSSSLNNSGTTSNSSSSTESTSDNNTNQDNVKTKETATIDDVIYPMYLPNNTTLANKEVIDTEDGQRLILIFTGENPFVLVEETISYQDEGLIIPVTGSMDFLTDVIGVVNDNSVNWDSNGIDYYIVSNTLKTEELLNIARSISVLPVSK